MQEKMSRNFIRICVHNRDGQALVIYEYLFLRALVVRIRIHEGGAQKRKEHGFPPPVLNHVPDSIRDQFGIEGMTTLLLECRSARDYRARIY